MDEMLVTRCAWCELCSVADEWVSKAELDAATAPGAPLRISHGICPICLVVLRGRRGR